MSVPYVGIGARVCFGVESTWGTAVSRTHHLPLNANSYMRRNVARSPRGVLYTGSRTRKGFFQPVETVEGQLVLELTSRELRLAVDSHPGHRGERGRGALRPHLHRWRPRTPWG
jgi:hypothetical protein